MQQSDGFFLRTTHQLAPWARLPGRIEPRTKWDDPLALTLRTCLGALCLVEQTLVAGVGSGERRGVSPMVGVELIGHCVPRGLQLMEGVDLGEV